MANESPQLFLFYSNHCPISNKLLGELGNNGFAYDNQNNIFIRQQGVQNKINMIMACCIDNPQVQRPPFLKVVPTLYVAPMKQALIEDNLNRWLSTNVLVQQKGQPSNTRGGSGGGGQFYQNIDITGEETISPFLSGELGGSLSDGYAPITETNDDLQKSNSGNPKYFSGLHDKNDNLQGNANEMSFRTGIMPLSKHGASESNSGGGGGGGSGGSGDKKGKSGKLDKAYESFMENRQRDVPMGSGRIG